MKKLLMTTTALIALGGVTSALADLSISGNAQWRYKAWSDDYIDTPASGDTANDSGNNNTEMTEGLEIWFKADQTADSGMTYGAAARLREGTTGVDRNYIYVSDDWGKVTFGRQWAPLYSGSLGADWRGTIKGGQQPAPDAVQKDSNIMTGSFITTSGKASKIIYDSPSISGFKLGVSMTDAGGASKADSTSWRATYGTDIMDGTGVKVSYGTESMKAKDSAESTADNDITELGLEVTSGDFTFAAVQIENSKERNKIATGASSTKTSEQKANEFELAYNVSDVLTLNFINFKNKEDAGTHMGDEYSSNAIGAKYEIAPGLTANLIYTKSEYTDATKDVAATAANENKNNDATATYVQIRMTF
ncbi:porin [Alphaproteobacteria bacterium]|nr:porin [Alphaproteobacteria bacterium]